MSQNTHGMPGAGRDDESGQYTEKYPTGRFLQAIDNVDGMAGTQDVADYVGCSYETAYKKLRKLEDSGSVNSQKVANARVWLRADEQTPSEHRETGENTAQTDDGRDTGTATVDATHSTLPDGLAILTADVGRDELPGSGAKLDERIGALQAVVAHLVERGTATPSDFQDDVYPDHPAQYDTPRSWWKNAMYPALASVAETTDAVKSADESGRWQFNGAADD